MFSCKAFTMRFFFTAYARVSRRKESTSWQTGSRWLLSHSLFFNVVCVAGRLVFFRPQRVFFWTARAFSFWQNNRGPEKDFYLFSGHTRGLEKDISGSKKRAARCRRFHKPHALRCTSNSVRLWSFKATLQEIWPLCGKARQAEVVSLSGEGVPVPCSVSATGLVSRHGSEFDISQACRFCNVRAGAQAISGAQKCLQRASKRL